ncbi:MAG TPA: outer membrane beta-barrel protein [Pedobacter sp.]|jgi:opacity protein-like surface antigen
MKKILLCAVLVAALTSTSNAQLNVGLNGNYINYGSDTKKVPGAQLRVGYTFREKYAAYAGFSYSMPAKQILSSSSTASAEQDSYMALSLSAIYHLIGRSDSKFSLYIPAGASYVLATNKTTIDGVTEKEKSSGPTINAGLGTQFAIGTPIIFLEAAIAMPANSTSNTVTGVTALNNSIPFHTILNLGVKLPLGGGSSGGF